MRRARGFTLVELMVTLGIVAVLSAIAVPKYQQLKVRAQSTQLIGDFDVVRQAAMNFFVDSGHFPGDVGAGVIPQGLERYLPNNFTFEKTAWTLDYENMGLQAGRTSIEIIGVAAKTADPRLSEITMQIFGPGASFVYNGKLLYLISGGI